MKLAFFGSPDFAVPTLSALHEAGHEIAVVVTRPDRPRGRHGTPQPTDVKVAALGLGLPLLQPDSANEAAVVEHLVGLGIDVGVTIAYGEILKPHVLATASLFYINLHASLLPDYRGAAPINWAIMRGEERTGVSVIKCTPRLDAGPVLLDESLDIESDETAGELFERLAQLSARLAVEVIGRLDAGERWEGRPQPSKGGFFARKLTKQDGRVHWDWPADKVVNRTRGLTPWPGAWCYLRGQDRRVRVTLASVKPADGSLAGGVPGEVLETDGRIMVRTGDGIVAVESLKPAGGRAMDASDFIHGYHLQPGDRFC